MAMASSPSSPLGFLLLILLLVVSFAHADSSSGTADGTEEWGYTDVRPGAHMFWWLYYKEKPVPSSNVPLVMWLQGGPGGSGVGFGNFHEVGPLNEDLEPRRDTWLKAAHLLFVDNPVGTGYSYVDNTTLLTRDNKEVVSDLITFLGKFFGAHKALQSTPFFVVAESYGGKFASELGVALKQKIDAGNLNINFRGVALGDTWVSPMDFLYSWPPLLQAWSLIDETDAKALLTIADSAQAEMVKGNYLNATNIWGEMEEAILKVADDVDFYNMLNHDKGSNVAAANKNNNLQGLARMAARHLSATTTADLDEVMNGPIRKKLKIIPNSISWQESSSLVFGALSEDFMKDTITQVDQLLAAGVNVTIYTGQLDLICCTTGTENWVRKLKWPGLKGFQAAKRSPLYCDGVQQTGAFVKRHKNLSYYWIMDAGHMVPFDNPCMALKMLKLITGQVDSAPRLQVAR